MIERLFKNWKTSMIGLFIIGVSFYAFYIGKVDLTGMFVGMGAGFIMFGLKDGKS